MNSCFYENYNIYDTFYSDHKLYIICPAENPPVNIKQANTNIEFYLRICPHGHTYIYYAHVDYCKNTTILINNEPLDIQVNHYPIFENEIIASTLVKHENNYLIQWIEYHKHLGINRFIIYDNADSTINTEGWDETNKELCVSLTHDDIRTNNHALPVEKALEKYIQTGTVVVIKWPYPYVLEKSQNSAQTTQQNHSLYAFQKSKYIGFFDIDEYMNPQGFATMEAVFDCAMKEQNKNYLDIGSFVIYNRWFYNPFEKNSTGYNFLCIDDCDRVHTDAHYKSFVMPKNVEIYNTHGTTLSKPSLCIDSQKMYFNHYAYLNKKQRGIQNKKLFDNSINDHLGFLPKQKEVVMFLNGGLGNQMFQIASAYNIAKTQNKRFFVKNILQSSHSSINYFENVFRKFSIKNDANYATFNEPESDFSIRINIPFFEENITLWGFFQNEKYFKHNRKEILELFEMEQIRENYLKSKYPDATKGVFIHYRRKDYLHNSDYNFLTDDYYCYCLKNIQKTFPDAVFFVFSDDLAHCKSLDYLRALERVIFVEEDDVNCLYLMSLCNYGGIGANSTYSWWGGWMNTNPNKMVMYPDKWLGERKHLDIWWNGCVRMNNRSKIYFLTFGGGPMYYLEAVDRIVKQAHELDLFDEVYGFKENDLKSEHPFWQNHRAHILQHPHGFGYWIWKPYLIHKIMSETQENDIIVYCDAGNEIDCRKKEKIKSLIDVAQDEWLMGNIVPDKEKYRLEKHYVKGDVLYHFGIDHNDPVLNEVQRQTNTLIIYKNEKTMAFIEEWCELCLEKYQYINDYKSYTENHPEFYRHRHDQSVFSLLTRKYGLFGKTETKDAIDVLRNNCGVSLL